jgi:hypothetical protein
MFAHIGVLKALHRHQARVFNPDRKDHHLGKVEVEVKEGPMNRA